MKVLLIVTFLFCFVTGCDDGTDQIPGQVAADMQEQLASTSPGIKCESFSFVEIEAKKTYEGIVLCKLNGEELRQPYRLIMDGDSFQWEAK